MPVQRRPRLQLRPWFVKVDVQKVPQLGVGRRQVVERGQNHICRENASNPAGRRQNRGAEPTRRLSQLHVHKVFVVIKKFGRLDSVQDGPGAVDLTGYHGNAGKRDALKSSKTGFKLIDDRSERRKSLTCHRVGG